jgi:hypothetical protein
MKSAEKMACSFDSAMSTNFWSLTWALMGISSSWRFKKKSARLILFKISRIAPLTALNIIEPKKLGVACHQNITYPSITLWHAPLWGLKIKFEMKIYFSIIRNCIINCAMWNNMWNAAAQVSQCWLTIALPIDWNVAHIICKHLN